MDIFNRKSLPFPHDKAHAIQVTTHSPGHPEKPNFTIRNGLSERFDAPPKHKHRDASWAQAHIDVEIGDIIPTGNDYVDDFNQKVLDIFNIASGNMLLKSNVLSWNLWLQEPDLVDTEEWRTHAERWRKSIDVNHGHESAPADYAEGFEPKQGFRAIWDEIHDLYDMRHDILKCRD